MKIIYIYGTVLKRLNNLKIINMYRWWNNVNT